MMKKLLIGLLLSFPFVVSGQGDNKLIKDAIQNNEITSIQIIADSSFHPGELLKFDIEIETRSGLKARASEKKIVSKEAGVFIEGGRQREPGEIETFEGNAFYPEKPLKITVELANATDSVKIFPSYCYKNFVISKTGHKGSRGGDGIPGSDGFSNMRPSPGGYGYDGSYGQNGPSFNLMVEEEVINGRPHIILDIDGDKYPVLPGCGTIRVQSIGGDGGNGGKGGNGGNAGRYQSRYRGSGAYGGNGGKGGFGGNGGVITVAGKAYTKYSNTIEIVSLGGKPGEAGHGGTGGFGIYSGMSGHTGDRGGAGEAGKVITTTDPVEKQQAPLKPKSITTTLILTSDVQAVIFIDGNKVGNLTPGKPAKLLLSPGVVAVEIKSLDLKSNYLKKEYNVRTGDQIKEHIVAVQEVK